MTRAAAGWLLLLGALDGCTAVSPRIESRALDAQSFGSSDRLIVAGVDNEVAPSLGHVGSTPRGYDRLTGYAPSAAARSRLRAVADQYGLQEVRAWPVQPLHMYCAVLEIPPGADRTALLAALVQDQRVILAQPLQMFATRTLAYNDPYVELQRGFRDMDVAGAHSSSRGEGVTVAIIDTGADIAHKDLHASVARATNFVDDDDRQFRADRHGTEVAGVIAAVANNREGIVGVAPAARLLIFKACWQLRPDADAARCNSFTLARAIVAAFDAHAQVINLSLAGPADPLLRALIQEGEQRGIIFVGAAPPLSADPLDSLLHQPGVIEVASAEDAGVRDSVLLAPGREILTLLPGGHYDFASGESIATAQVTGVVALLLARSPKLSAQNARQILAQSGMRRDSVGIARASINACFALAAVVGHGACAAPREDASHPPAEHSPPSIALQ